MPSATSRFDDTARSWIDITLDYARLIKLDEPAQTVVIGNPAIVDGTISDRHTLVLTGKTLGTTNLIILGEAGRPISHLFVSVATNDHGRITVHNASKQQTYSCIGSCMPAATAGANNSPPQGQ